MTIQFLIHCHFHQLVLALLSRATENRLFSLPWNLFFKHLKSLIISPLDFLCFVQNICSSYCQELKGAGVGAGKNIFRIADLSNKPKMRVEPLIAYCDGISRSLKAEKVLILPVPFSPWNTARGWWGSVKTWESPLLREPVTKGSSTFINPEVCILW